MLIPVSMIKATLFCLHSVVGARKSELHKEEGVLMRRQRVRSSKRHVILEVFSGLRWVETLLTVCIMFLPECHMTFWYFQIFSNRIRNTTQESSKSLCPLWQAYIILRWRTLFSGAPSFVWVSHLQRRQDHTQNVWGLIEEIQYLIFIMNDR
jgi:hypothetical protein